MNLIKLESIKNIWFKIFILFFQFCFQVEVDLNDIFSIKCFENRIDLNSSNRRATKLEPTPNTDTEFNGEEWTQTAEINSVAARIPTHEPSITHEDL